MNFGKSIFLLMLVTLSICSAMAAPSPWDSWRSGYTNFEKGENMRERGSYTEALKLFERARANYQAVRTARPDWNQRVIAERLRDCDRQIAELRRLLGTGGQTPADVASRVTEEKKNQEVEKKHSSGTEKTTAENYTAREIALRKELNELKLRYADMNRELNKQRNFESEIAALLRDSKVAEDRYALLEKRYLTLQDEMKRPNEKYIALEQQLISEKMNTERLEKQLTGTVKQMNVDRENLRLSTAAKKALEDLLAKRDAELRDYHRQLSEAVGQLQQIPVLKENAADLERRLKQREQELQELKTQSTADRDSSQVQSHLNEATIVAMKEDISVLKQRLDDMRKQRDDIGIQLRSVQKNLDAVSAEKQTMQINLLQEQQNSKLNADELTILRERNRELENDVRALYERAGDLEKRLAARNSEDFKAAATARESIKVMENNLLAVQNELVVIRSENSELKNKLTESERKFKVANDESVKARTELLTVKERESVQLKELEILRPVKKKFEQLQRNFNALAAENQENKKRLEAAEPTAAELERARLRLLEYDKIRRELAKEQQLNGEIKEAFNRDQMELKELRRRAGEFETTKRKMIELEAKLKEMELLQGLEKELAVLRQREVELAALKIKFNEVSNSLRQSNAELASLNARLKKSDEELAAFANIRNDLQKAHDRNAELEEMLRSQEIDFKRFAKETEDVSGQNELSASEYSKTLAELNNLRMAAVKNAGLSDQVVQLQEKLQKLETIFKQQHETLLSVRQELELKRKEAAEWETLSKKSLKEIQEISAGSLLNKVDASRMVRLEDELDALNKLHADLAAERDKLAALLEIRNDGSNELKLPALQSHRPPEELISAGAAAEQEDKLELAIWHYRQALANRADFIPAHLKLGLLFYNRGSFAEAVPHLTNALNADPQNKKLAIITVRSYIAVSRFGNAKSIIDTWIKKYPEDADIVLCSALIELGCGNIAKAEELFIQAANLNPKSNEIKIELAKFMVQYKGDMDKAVKIYEDARNNGNPPESLLEKVLESRLNQRRDLLNFMNSAAREAELAGDWRSAAWYYQKIKDNDHREFAVRLAFAQWKSGDATRAKITLDTEEGVIYPVAMLVRALIAFAENDEQTAVSAARGCSGAVIPSDWVGLRMEIENLKKKSKLTIAEQLLLNGIKVKNQ